MPKFSPLSITNIGDPNHDGTSNVNCFDVPSVQDELTGWVTVAGGEIAGDV